MANLTIKQSAEGNFKVLKLAGKIDSDTSPELIAALDKLIKSGSVNIILDLAGVTFMSSAGIGATTKALNETRSGGGDLRIASIKPDVKKVYELLGFHKAFKFYNTVGEAAK